MPVAFNPPPFPTADIAIAAATDSTAGVSPLAVDAFAQLLLVAGGDPGAIGDKGAGADMTGGRRVDARGGRAIADPRDAPPRLPPRDPLPPIGAAKRDDTAETVPKSSGEISPDPAAMTVALSATIVSGLKSDVLFPRCATAGELSAPANSAHPVPPNGPSRLDADALRPASTALTPMVGVSVDQQLAASAASKELIELPAAKLKQTSAAGVSDYSAQAVSTSPLTPPQRQATVHTIDTPVTAPGWEGEFAGKLAQVIMLRNDRAEFHLHPAELGPIDIQISFASDQAVVLITAPHATTRDALEQTLPYLRDMLADRGIALGQANVQSERNPADPGGPSRGDAAGQRSGLKGSPDNEVLAIQLRGLVDVFA